MSSTYVEVREAENGVGELGFQINDCETNGIDFQSHYNTFPAKDHTYNKDPSFDEDFLSQNKKNTETKNNENELPKKIVRAHRSIKHKIIKPRYEEPVVTKPEKEEIKKSPSKTIGAEDPATESIITQDENKTTIENNESTVTIETSENVIPEITTTKKSNRKRKIEEVNNQPDIKVEEKTAKSPKKKKSQVSSKAQNESPSESFPEKGIKEDKKESTKKSKAHATRNAKVTKTPETKNTKKTANEIKSAKKIADEVKSARKAAADEAKSTKKSADEAKNMKKVPDEIPQEKAVPVKNVDDAESQGVPPGWSRKVVERKSGKTAGLCDVYIYSPEGIKFRSRPDVAAYLLKTKSKLRIEDFSFKRSSQPTPISMEEKKPSKVAEKELKKEKVKEKTARPSKKKTTTLKVKIATPRKAGNKIPTNKEISKSGEAQTSNSVSKRTGANRKRKNT